MSAETLFKLHLEDAGIVDAEGTHHEFVGRKFHGQKVDFDKIPDRSSLFDEWVELTAQALKNLYTDEQRWGMALVSTANGTNRLVEPVAEILDSGIIVLQTEKIDPETVALTGESLRYVADSQPRLAVHLEDATKTGATSYTGILSAWRAGIQNCEVLNSWQRTPRLPVLELAGVTYHSIINEELLTLTAEECRADGFCAEGWDLIEYGS